MSVIDCWQCLAGIGLVLQLVWLTGGFFAFLLLFYYFVADCARFTTQGLMAKTQSEIPRARCIRPRRTHGYISGMVLILTYAAYLQAAEDAEPPSVVPHGREEVEDSPDQSPTPYSAMLAMASDFEMDTRRKLQDAQQCELPVFDVSLLMNVDGIEPHGNVCIDDAGLAFEGDGYVQANIQVAYATDSTFSVAFWLLKSPSNPWDATLETETLDPYSFESLYLHNLADPNSKYRGIEIFLGRRAWLHAWALVVQLGTVHSNFEVNTMVDITPKWVHVSVVVESGMVRLFEDGHETSATSVEDTGKLGFKGCFADPQGGGQPRMGGGEVRYPSIPRDEFQCDMTTSEHHCNCLANCAEQGFRYGGIQWTGECACASDYGDYGFAEGLKFSHDWGYTAGLATLTCPASIPDCYTCGVGGEECGDGSASCGFTYAVFDVMMGQPGFTEHGEHDSVHMGDYLGCHARYGHEPNPCDDNCIPGVSASVWQDASSNFDALENVQADGTTVLDIFELVESNDVFTGTDNYADHLMVDFVAPQDGEYMFVLAGDDEAELWFGGSGPHTGSLSYPPTGADRIASVPGWTTLRQWDKYTEQTSAPIHLQAGQVYRLETFHHEGTGPEAHAAVGVTLPDQTRVWPIDGALLGQSTDSAGLACCRYVDNIHSSDVGSLQDIESSIWFSTNFEGQDKFRADCAASCESQNFTHMGLFGAQRCWCTNEYHAEPLKSDLAAGCGANEGSNCGDGHEGSCTLGIAVFELGRGRMQTVAPPPDPIPSIGDLSDMVYLGGSPTRQRFHGRMAFVHVYDIALTHSNIMDCVYNGERQLVNHGVLARPRSQCSNGITTGCTSTVAQNSPVSLGV
eukprot:COSAG06_NODE_6433_length_2934_cov_2.514457_1_plen_853_part_01